MLVPIRLRFVAPLAVVTAAAAVGLIAAGQNGAGASPKPDPATPSVRRLDNGATRVVIPLSKPVPVRNAAPLVLNGDTPLGFGDLAPDRRSVVIDTRAGVGSGAALRVAWSGGGVPVPRNARANAARPPASTGGTTTQPGLKTAPTEALPASVSDPGAKGPLATTRAQYTLGDTALKVPTGYQVEVTGEVTYPSTLGTKPRPLVILLHGRHNYCGRSDGKTAYKWPCPAGYRRIPSEQGYRPLADLLASHGIVVVSVAANGINAGDDAAADAGARDRGYLVMHHLNLWHDWSTTNTTGPFGSRFHGVLDFTKVGLMGHSRGGEGVVAALAENKRTGSKYGIKAVVPLAPVDFTRQTVRGTASMTLVPYCDGDVSDLEGVHFFDDATTGTVDRVPHALLGVLGANHNFFNTVWTPGGWEAGANDDWSELKDPLCGTKSDRLTAKQQVAAGTAYMAAFLRARLQGSTRYDALFRGNTATPHSAAPAKTVAAWSAPASRRLLVNDARSATTNALGGAVRASGFDAALRCGGDSRYALTCIAPRGAGDEPHLSLAYLAPNARGLSQMHLVWSRPDAVWSNTLPASHRDVAGYRYVTVRLTKDVWALSSTPPSIGLRLKDTAGHTQTVRLSGPALNTPVTSGPTAGGWGSVPHALVVSVPVPLTSFGNVDLKRVESVALVALGKTGDMTVGDVSFQR
jgi:hypothetical protein